MDGDQFTNAFCSGCACICRCLHGADIASNHYSNKSPTNFLLAHELNSSCLDHGVGGFDGAHESAGFHHSECNSVFV